MIAMARLHSMIPKDFAFLKKGQENVLRYFKGQVHVLKAETLSYRYVIMEFTD